MPLDGVKETMSSPRGPAASAKQGSQGLRETEATNPNPAWVCARSSAYMLLYGMVI